MVSSTAANELPTLKLSSLSKQEKILSLLSCYTLDKDIQEAIKTTFQKEMELGLSPSPSKPSSVLMENTYIEEVLNGTEEGRFMSLDLGGTNFRVIVIELQKGKVVFEDVAYYEVPEKLRLGPGVDLFDFLSSCIEDFLHVKKINNRHYELGFTFSFPMTQKAVNIGILNSWTKSFNCPGVVGHDVVLMLQTAINNRNLDVTINSVLNDTTGTLVQGSYLDHRCAIGMILGTGHNACYLEKVQNIKKWKGDHTEKEVIIDIEWGAFGDNGVLDFLRTKWDDLVDDKSLLRKSYTFEKYIAGKYLGDLVRETLVTLSEEGVFCDGPTELLKTHHSLKTLVVSNIEGDTLNGKEATHAEKVLTDFGLKYSEDDIQIIQYVCAVVSYRAVLLVSLLTGIIINRMDRDHCTVAIDGSLFEFHPRFKRLMEHLISLEAPGKSFSLLLAKDGSGKGAGLVAAIENRLAKTKLAK